MKHLKSKLMASAAMLMVATVMISSASFAWFTISTAPEIAGIDTGLAANGNLEIALASSGTQTEVPVSAVGDTGKNCTWGNLVDLSAMADKVTLKPVDYSYASNAVAFKVPSFGMDGRIKELKDATGAFMNLTGTGGLNPDSTQTTFKDGGITVYKDAADSSNYYAFRVDYFMRTNTVGDIKLVEASTDRGAGTADMGGGTTITANSPVTVAFSVNGAEPVQMYYPKAVGTSGETGYHAAGSWDFTTPLFSVVAADASSGIKVNETVKVSMYVYWNGANMTNADFGNAVTDLKLNVQFKHSATLEDIGIDGTTDVSERINAYVAPVTTP